MNVIQLFAAAFISNHPGWTDFLTWVAVIGLFVVAPIALFVILKTKYNNGRYVFEKRKIFQTNAVQDIEHLYLLDTVKGDLFFVEGNYHYKRMVIYDRDDEATVKDHRSFWSKLLRKKS